MRSDLKRARYLGGGGAAGVISEGDAETVAATAVERVKQSIRDAGLVRTGLLVRSITARIKAGRVRAAAAAADD